MKMNFSSFIQKIGFLTIDWVQGVLAARGFRGKEKTVSSKIRELEGLLL